MALPDKTRVFSSVDSSILHLTRRVPYPKARKLLDFGLGLHCRHLDAFDAFALSLHSTASPLIHRTSINQESTRIYKQILRISTFSALCALVSTLSLSHYIFRYSLFPHSLLIFPTSLSSSTTLPRHLRGKKACSRR